MTGDPLGALAELGLASEVPAQQQRRVRHLIALGAGAIVTLAVATFLLLAVLPPVADFFASVFLFVARFLTGR